MSKAKVYTISRVFNAPRELVWKAWTNKYLAPKWFGPKGCTITYHEFNIAPGGKASYSLEFNGFVMHGYWKYLEVSAPEKLVALVSFTDKDGNIAANPGEPNWPKVMHSTVTFKDLGGYQTEVTVNWQPHEASEIEIKTFEAGFESMTEGWGGSFDQLSAFLAMLTSHGAVTPYLMFAGRCDEALEFYKKALNAKVEMLMRFNEAPDKAPEGMLQKGFENKVMHSSFIVNGTRIMASDGCNDKNKFDGFSLALSLLPDEIDTIFNNLAEGGNVFMPLTKTFWSPRYGMLTDKFGVSWMLMVPQELG